MTIKVFKSPAYHFLFNTADGQFLRWGKELEDNPDYSPFGPEIADIEISTICSKGCPWCYKSNVNKGQNMSLETFKRVFEALPKDTLTQIAFGIGDVDANPDMIPIFQYTRESGVIPNVTVNGEKLTEKIATSLASVCGAIAVSNYGADKCYKAVELLSSFTEQEYPLKQVNIHQLLSAETYTQCLVTMNDIVTNYRLSRLNAIVFLSLKRKGRGAEMHPVTNSQLKDLSTIALNDNIPIGFDSCSANTFLKIAQELGKGDLESVIEPCESSLFSAYIDVNGNFLPCSFSSGHFNPIPVIGRDFLMDVWNHPQTLSFREKLLQQHRNCPFYNILDN